MRTLLGARPEMEVLMRWWANECTSLELTYQVAAKRETVSFRDTLRAEESLFSRV